MLFSYTRKKVQEMGRAQKPKKTLSEKFQKVFFEVRLTGLEPAQALAH